MDNEITQAIAPAAAQILDYRETVAWAVTGLTAALGAVGNYLYVTTMKKSVTPSWGRFSANIVLGFIIGQIVGDFLPQDFHYRDGVLLTAGFSVYTIAQALEERGGPAVRAMVDRIFSWMPGASQAEDAEK